MEQNMKWTPEPWHSTTHDLVKVNGGIRTRVSGEHAGDRFRQLTETDYARARLCVNACAGLSAEQIAAIPNGFTVTTPDGKTCLLMPGDSLEVKAPDYDAIRAQRDELAAALQKIANQGPARLIGDTPVYHASRDIARTALAKVQP